MYEHSFRVDNILIHPDFRHNGPYSNDIALMKVRANSAAGISFNTHVRPICIASTDEMIDPGTWCSVTGWGLQRSQDSKSIAPILRAAAVPLLEQNTCRRSDVHGDRDDGKKQQQPILDTMLCAGMCIIKL